MGRGGIDESVDGLHTAAVHLVEVFRPRWFARHSSGLVPAHTQGTHPPSRTAHLSPCCPPPCQVGLNAHRVFHYKEWRRLGTSLAVHSDLPHLVSNSAGLVLEVSQPELRPVNG